MLAVSRDHDRPIAAGTGQLVVEHGARGSVVTRALATSPLKWLTPLVGGPAAWIFSSSYGGGLVGGDALSIDVSVGAGASALLSTQASTKVYRSKVGTTVHLTARVAEDGLLINLPDPIVCFADAGYRQVQQFDVAPRASLVTLDWMTSGRMAYGERWAFDEYVTSTRVRLDGRLLVHDVVRLRRTDGSLADRLGRFDVLAVLIVIGPRLADDVRKIVETVAAVRPERRPSILVSAAPLADGAGCVVRIAGMQIEDVRQTVRGLLDFVPALLGDDPWARKW